MDNSLPFKVQVCLASQLVCSKTQELVSLVVISQSLLEAYSAIIQRQMQVACSVHRQHLKHHYSGHLNSQDKCRI
jgi:hypothetical protein